MKIRIHGFVYFSWFMKITVKNFMTQFSTMKPEIAVFMALKKSSWVFQHIFTGFS